METRFRLLRSRAFWFGVPGFVFLLWAWGDSMRYFTSISGSGRVGTMVTQVLGTATFAVWQDHSSTGFNGFGMEREVIHDEGAAMRAKVRPEIDLAWMLAPSDQSSVSISVQHRVALSGYLFLWLALIVWRWRRFNRALMETPTE